MKLLGYHYDEDYALMKTYCVLLNLHAKRALSPLNNIVQCDYDEPATPMILVNTLF